ncbi:hypothetical protein [Variovorax sp. LT1R16]|uniref:hypothetical protein n=1 Tax=Variovorax sp. LT1R16 TaxID=3443728 RepID=UPI003F47FAE0
MKKLLPLLVLTSSLALHVHGAARNPYSAEEARTLLASLGAHVMVINSDLTLRKKQPAKEFDLLAYYPLSKDKVDEYKRSGQLKKKRDDIANFATYRIKNYQLTNEKNETLQLEGVDSGPLENFPLWTYDNVLCGQLGLYVKLDKRFERLKGHMTLVLEVPGGIAHETRVPIDLSITDRDPRPGI